MLDLKFIREFPDKVKTGLANKNDDPTKVDKVLELDLKRRDIITQVEELKAKRNQASQQIGMMKKSGEDATSMIAEMKRVSDMITDYDGKLSEIENDLDGILSWLPNLPHESVPVGKSSEENVEDRKWTPDGFSFENDFKVKDHVELGKSLKILDFERGAKVCKLASSL